MPTGFILSLLAVLQPEAETFATHALSIPFFLPELLWALLVLISLLHSPCVHGRWRHMHSGGRGKRMSEIQPGPETSKTARTTWKLPRKIHMYKCCLSPVITKEDLKFKVYVCLGRRFLLKHQMSFNTGSAWIPSGDRS